MTPGLLRDARYQRAALLVCLVAVGACGTGSDGEDVGERSFDSVSVRVDYRPGESCPSAGYGSFVVGVDAEGLVAFLDHHSDGSVDLLRDDGDVYFRASSFEGFESVDGWIRASVDTGHPASALLRASSLGPLSYSLLGSPLSSPTDQLAEIQDRSADGTALLDPADPDSDVVSFELDGAGEIVSAVVEPQHETPLTPQRITLQPDSGTPGRAVELPAADDVVELGSLRAALVLRSSQLLDPRCRESAHPGDPEAEAQCVDDTVGDLTVDEWLQTVGADDVPSVPPIELTSCLV